MLRKYAEFVKMRCFIAIDLPNEVKKGLSRLQQKLPEAKLKLVEPENLHLTLVFLGELNDFQINKCKEALKNIKFEKFRARTGSTGIFPNKNFIRVVWVALEPAHLLKELHNQVFQQIKNTGLQSDERFESHITLARIKLVPDRKKFIENLEKIQPDSSEFEVNSLALKKSTLTRDGPVYEDIATFNLA